MDTLIFYRSPLFFIMAIVSSFLYPSLPSTPILLLPRDYIAVSGLPSLARKRNHPNVLSICLNLFLQSPLLSPSPLKLLLHHKPSSPFCTATLHLQSLGLITSITVTVSCAMFSFHLCCDLSSSGGRAPVVFCLFLPYTMNFGKVPSSKPSPNPVSAGISTLHSCTCDG